MFKKISKLSLVALMAISSSAFAQKAVERAERPERPMTEKEKKGVEGIKGESAAEVAKEGDSKLGKVIRMNREVINPQYAQFFTDADLNKPGVKEVLTKVSMTPEIDAIMKDLAGYVHGLANGNTGRAKAFILEVSNFMVSLKASGASLPEYGRLSSLAENYVKADTNSSTALKGVVRILRETADIVAKAGGKADITNSMDKATMSFLMDAKNGLGLSKEEAQERLKLLKENRCLI